MVAGAVLWSRPAIGRKTNRDEFREAWRMQPQWSRPDRPENFGTTQFWNQQT
jgi:hypothetical protein